MLTIEVVTESKAFRKPNGELHNSALSELVHEIATLIKQGVKDAKIKDFDGNDCGKVKIT